MVLAWRLSARARHRGTVLVPTREWPAGLGVEADHGTWHVARGTWHGLGDGRGRLRCRTVNVVVRGRGAAERPRQAPMWLPPLTGPLPMIRSEGPTGTAPSDCGHSCLWATA